MIIEFASPSGDSTINSDSTIIKTTNPHNLAGGDLVQVTLTDIGINQRCTVTNVVDDKKILVPVAIDKVSYNGQLNLIVQYNPTTIKTTEEISSEILLGCKVTIEDYSLLIEGSVNDLLQISRLSNLRLGLHEFTAGLVSSIQSRNLTVTPFSPPEFVFYIRVKPTTDIPESLVGQSFAEVILC